MDSKFTVYRASGSGAKGNKMKKALLQIGYGVLATGDTRDECIANWLSDTSYDDNDASEIKQKNQAAIGDKIIIDISDEFSAHINQYGGDVSYDIVDGILTFSENE